MAIFRTNVRHASYIVSQLPEEAKTEKRQNKKEQFFEGLPEKFCRKHYLMVTKTINISERTAQGYIAKFCERGLINHEQHDSYV